MAWRSTMPDQSSTRFIQEAWFARYLAFVADGPPDLASEKAN